MKSLNELEILLIDELNSANSNFDNCEKHDYYLNGVLGKSSIYLTSILHELLFANQRWNRKKWLDDSLITKFHFDEKRCSIWGVVISGKNSTTKQWTDPFYYEFKIEGNLTEYTFLFADCEDEELDYMEYKNNRGYWDSDFYSDLNWTPSERNWDYIFHVLME